MKHITARLMLAAMLTLSGPAAQAACPSNPLPQATSGYGADGNQVKRTLTFSNPANTSQTVYVYYPKNATPAPTVFLSHGFGASSPNFYMATINHLVSRGYSVVFPEYPLTGSVESHYTELWTGFEEAVARYPNRLDASRVAFLGHSFGGGATPRMALNAQQAGWGSAGMAMYIMAPWYSLQLSDADLAGFDPDVKMVMLTFDDDVVNDHEMGIEIFHNTPIPYADKAFIKLLSDTASGCTLIADHAVPTDIVHGELDGLDYWNWYHIDALLDYTFTGNATARDIALGGGSYAQTYWGTWWTSAPYEPAQVSINPLPTINTYDYPCNDPQNPRVARCGTRY